MATPSSQAHPRRSTDIRLARAKRGAALAGASEGDALGWGVVGGEVRASNHRMDAAGPALNTLSRAWLVPGFPADGGVPPSNQRARRSPPSTDLLRHSLNETLPPSTGACSPTPAHVHNSVEPEDRGNPK